VLCAARAPISFLSFVQRQYWFLESSNSYSMTYENETGAFLFYFIVSFCGCETIAVFSDIILKRSLPSTSRASAAGPALRTVSSGRICISLTYDITGWHGTHVGTLFNGVFFLKCDGCGCMEVRWREQ